VIRPTIGLSRTLLPNKTTQSPTNKGRSQENLAKKLQEIINHQNSTIQHSMIRRSVGHKQSPFSTIQASDNQTRIPFGNQVYKSQKFNGRYSTARGSPDPAHTINTKLDTADEGTILNIGEHTQMRISNARENTRTSNRPIRAGKIQSSTAVPTMNEDQTI